VHANGNAVPASLAAAGMREQCFLCRSASTTTRGHRIELMQTRTVFDDGARFGKSDAEVMRHPRVSVVLLCARHAEEWPVQQHQQHQQQQQQQQQAHTAAPLLKMSTVLQRIEQYRALQRSRENGSSRWPLTASENAREIGRNSRLSVERGDSMFRQQQHMTVAEEDDVFDAERGAWDRVV